MKILRALISMLVGIAFLSLWFWLLPPILGFRSDGFRDDLARAPWWRLAGFVPAILGFGIGIECIWHFGATGEGTPAPFAPPRRLVVVGIYRFVRNPMYVGFLIGWLGLWIAFGAANWASMIVLAVFIALANAIVLLHEEPALRRSFGGDYEEYCANVPRWIPRLTPWTPGRAAAPGR